jgi:mono/diheme cytochrome c family protein
MILVPALSLLPGLQAQAPAKTVNELKGFFAANCVKCHGADGSGRSADGAKLGGFDFTDAKAAA